MHLLTALLSHADHQCWVDAFLWCAMTAIRGDQFLALGLITNIYLLAIAMPRQGTFVRLDALTKKEFVPCGHGVLYLIPPLP